MSHIGLSLLEQEKQQIVEYYFSQLSNLQQQRIIVEQLRREAAIKRISMSQAIEDIKANSNF